MITPQRALTLIFENTKPLGAETSDIAACYDRVLAKDIYAKIDLPPFSNSAMDGYAVRAEDSKGANKENPKTFIVRQTVRAGSGELSRLNAGEAIKIMTGASIPDGADCVVMKEVTLELDGKVQIFKEGKLGQNVRQAGEDIKAGNLLLKKGTHLRPYEISLLASQGIQEAETIRNPKVSILSTGDELVPLGQSLTRGKIFNSNGIALSSALKRWGIEVQDFGIVADEPKMLRESLLKAATQSDLLLVTGGVSVGDYDYTRALLLELGVREVFWKAAIKPGKPLFFGVWASEEISGIKLVFGLPGNPVSVLICLEEFVRPALEKLEGYIPQHSSYHLTGISENDYPKPVDRQQYLFCQAASTSEGYRLHIIRPQGSAMMGMASQANALAVAPIGKKNIRAGDPLPFRWLK